MPITSIDQNLNPFGVDLIKEEIEILNKGINYHPNSKFSNTKKKCWTKNIILYLSLGINTQFFLFQTDRFEILLSQIKKNAHFSTIENITLKTISHNL